MHTSIADLLAEARQRLADVGIASARLDARLLAAHALGCASETVLGRGRELVGPPATQAFEALIQRRLAREPVSRILGRREFWSLEFELVPAALDPRPDSETLIEAVLLAFPDKAAPLDILDLGTGSGCLLLAILSEYANATGLGVDISAACCAVAGRNAGRLGLGDRAEFRVGDWSSAHPQTFDVVVSNPPYIADTAIGTLAPEVRLFDPRTALSGGPDGLDCYRALAAQIPAVMRPAGRVFLELGEGMAEEVGQIMAQAELLPVEIRNDLAGTERCLVLKNHK